MCDHHLKSMFLSHTIEDGFFGLWRFNFWRLCYTEESQGVRIPKKIIWIDRKAPALKPSASLKQFLFQIVRIHFLTSPFISVFHNPNEVRKHIPGFFCVNSGACGGQVIVGEGRVGKTPRRKGTGQLEDCGIWASNMDPACSSQLKLWSGCHAPRAAHSTGRVRMFITVIS